MKRDPRLQGLSSEHHQALVMARAIARRHEQWTPQDGAWLEARFAAELAPHFAIEERLLLPALEGTEAALLAMRMRDDHDFLRDARQRAAQGDGAQARAFGERLREHVRFEEQQLFPACERLLPSDVLEAVARAMQEET